MNHRCVRKRFVRHLVVDIGKLAVIIASGVVLIYGLTSVVDLYWVQVVLDWLERILVVLGGIVIIVVLVATLLAWIADCVSRARNDCETT